MKVWILNHYATDMYFDSGGRHHSLAKYLIKLGHDVKIFCANTEHNSSRIVDTKGCLYVERIGEDSVPYGFINSLISWKWEKSYIKHAGLLSKDKESFAE